MPWAKSLGKCVVCGEPVASHEEGLEFLYPQRVLVHLGHCAAVWDGLHGTVVRRLVEGLARQRQAAAAPAPPTTPPASEPVVVRHKRTPRRSAPAAAQGMLRPGGQLDLFDL